MRKTKSTRVIKKKPAQITAPSHSSTTVRKKRNVPTKSTERVYSMRLRSREQDEEVKDSNVFDIPMDKDDEEEVKDQNVSAIPIEKCDNEEVKRDDPAESEIDDDRGISKNNNLENNIKLFMTVSQDQTEIEDMRAENQVENCSSSEYFDENNVEIFNGTYDLDLEEEEERASTLIKKSEEEVNQKNVTPWTLDIVYPFDHNHTYVERNEKKITKQLDFEEIIQNQIETYQPEVTDEEFYWHMSSYCQNLDNSRSLLSQNNILDDISTLPVSEEEKMRVRSSSTLPDSSQLGHVHDEPMNIFTPFEDTLSIPVIGGGDLKKTNQKEQSQLLMSPHQFDVFGSSSSKSHQQNEESTASAALSLSIPLVLSEGPTNDHDDIYLLVDNDQDWSLVNNGQEKDPFLQIEPQLLTQLLTLCGGQSGVPT